MLEPISGREIAITGMRAQRTRMNVIANNIANAMTTRTEEGGPFRRQLTVFRGDQLGKTPRKDRFGVRVKDVITDSSPVRRVYEPSHPDADAEGYVAYPNVNMAAEMVDLISAQRAFEANIAVVVSDRRMKQRALEIIQQ